jgi:hypothetical protein
MKDADPWAQIGVPWAFGSAVAGAMVPDNTEWNNTVLGQDGNLIGFVDAHYYPFGFSGATGDSNPTDQQVLQALMSVPSDYQAIRSELDTYNPRAQVVVGETGVSNNETTTVCTPAGALFAAGDVLSWLAAGAETVDWWDMNNYGNTGTTCTNPDYGMFTSASPPAPETPYEHVLAEYLAHYNDHRSHRALDQRPPETLGPAPDPIGEPDPLQLRRNEVLGGIIHEYRLVA